MLTCGTHNIVEMKAVITLCKMQIVEATGGFEMNLNRFEFE